MAEEMDVRALASGSSGRAPKVFISYAHDDAAHEATVRRFYEFLRVDCGIDAVFDRIAAQSPRDWTAWMVRALAEADFVLCIASPDYRAAADAALPSDVRRGAQWETRLLREEFYANEPAARARILAVVLPGGTTDDIPSWMSPTAATHFRVTTLTQDGAEALLRYLTAQPDYVEPPLGRLVTFSSVRKLSLAVGRASTPESLAVALSEDGVETAAHEGRLTPIDPWISLRDEPTRAEARLAAAGRTIGDLLYGGPIGPALAAAFETTPAGSFVELAVSIEDGLPDIAVELASLSDGRVPVLEPGVRLYRVGGSAVPPLPGPLKILVAVGAPDETRTDNSPLDMEAELQSVMDAVADIERSSVAQVRILEVAGLAQVTEALAQDQFHVLHLSGHGSRDGIELEDEDGAPQQVSGAELVAAIKRAGRSLPLVFLSSCHGSSGSGASLAAHLVRGGVGAVVAMQAPVSDVYATLLARVFYRELGRLGGTPAAALAIARQTLETDRRTAAVAAEAVLPPEFAIPVVIGSANRVVIDPAAVEQKLARLTSFTRLGPVPELPAGRLIGRRNELRTTLRALRDDARSVEEHGWVPGVQLLGIGGIGKSVLAGRVMARLREEGWAIAAIAGAWRPDALFAAVIEAMAGRRLDDDEQRLVDRLAHGGDELERLGAVAALLRVHRLLVVLDNAEDNLTAGGQSFQDEAFAQTLRVLVSEARAGRLLVTSRYPLPGFDDLLSVPVMPLTRAQVGRLLLRLGRLKGLSPEDRTMLYRTVGGHPRVLEFVDALLRGGRSDLSHVNAKLRALATAEGVALSGTDELDEAVQAALAVGSRDILLPELLALLSESERTTLFQLSVSSLPMDARALASTLSGGDPSGAPSIAAELRRLVDVSLVTPMAGTTFLVHRWTAQALLKTDGDDDAWQARFRRAGEHRLARLQAGEGALADASEAARNFYDAGDIDAAVGLITEIAQMNLPTLRKAAFLGEVIALVPEEHPNFPVVLDIEAQALVALGFASAALLRYQRLLAMQAPLAAAHPTNVEIQRALSVTYSRLGDLTAAAGNGAEAARLYREDLAIAERLAAVDPANVEFQRDLSVSYNKLGDLTAAAGDRNEAERLYRVAMAIRERLAAAEPTNLEFQRDLSVSYNQLGALFVSAGNVAEAERLYRETLAITERLAAADPKNPRYQRDLSVSYTKLGDLMAASNAAEAERLYREALAIAERLAAADPSNVDFQRGLSVFYSRLGGVMERAGRAAEAERLYRDDLAIAERLAATDPANVEFQRDLSVSYNKLGDFTAAAGNAAEAERLYREASAIAERLAATDPANIQFQRDLEVTYGRLGDLMAAAGNAAEAERLYRADLAIAERLAATDPANTQFQRDLEVTCGRLGAHFVSEGNTAEAERLHRQALAIAERLAAADPANMQYQQDLSVSYRVLGDLMAADDLDGAGRLYGHALAIRERLASTDPANAEFQHAVLVVYGRLGELAVAAGDGAEAERCFVNALAIAERLVAADPANAEFQRDLSVSYNKLGDVMRAAGGRDEAERLYRMALDIRERLAAADPGNVQFQQDLSASRQRLQQLGDTPDQSASDSEPTVDDSVE